MEGEMANIEAKSEPLYSRSVLTHRTLEALKPRPEAYRMSDVRCPGLAIRIAPGGLKSWEVAFRIRGTGKVRRKALGPFPAVGLEDARERATEMVRAAQAGRDLIREEADAAAAAAARIIVDELRAEYVKRACAKLRTKHEIDLRLKRALEPLKDRPVDEIRRRDLRKVFVATADRGAPREAEKQRQSVHAMFRWGVGEDLVETNPVTGLKPFSAGEPRERVLSLGEVRTLWDWIAASDLTPDMQDSLRLQLCLGSRIGEVAGLHLEEVDQDNWIWTLPARRSKNKKPRLTPLVGLARRIIEARLERTRGGPLFVNETGAALRSNDIGSAIVTRRKRIPLDHFVSHDLRRTVATQLVELGISFELVAAILGHETGNANTRILSRHYVRTNLVEQKRVALAAWDRRLSEIIVSQTVPTNVVQLSDVMRAAI
jgi:integrase